MMPWTGATPRRARYLIPEGTPRRREVIAACAVAILVAHLLLAQLTLVLAVILAAAGKASRWRPWWLLAPAAAGLAWALAVGPENALAGFTAGPSSILWHLGGGHLAGRSGHPFAGFGGVGSWLPRQLPVALVAGAAEAALIGWLDWLHTDEWAVPPPRPGLVAAVRRAVAGRAIGAGGVLTREGVALGVASATGARAELRWAELTQGTLVTGAMAQDVTLAGLQMVHAALRLRKPVIVLDPGDAAIVGVLDAACAATGVPLLAADASSGAGRAASVRGAAAGGADAGGGLGSEGAGASGLWGRAVAAGREPGGHAAGNLGRAPGARPEPGGWVAGSLGRAPAAQRETSGHVAGNWGGAPGVQREPGGQVGGESGRLAAAQREFSGHVAGNSGRVVTGQSAAGGLVADHSGRAVAGEREPGGLVADGLGRAVRERSAVLVTAGSAGLAGRVCAELATLAAGLGRIGVDGDALVWVPHGESVPASALASLLRDAPGGGLAVVIATTSPATAAELRGLTGSALVYRVADPDLAAGLVTLAGTRLLPRSLAMRAAAPMAGVPVTAGPMTAGPMTAGPTGGSMSSAQPAGAPMAVGPMPGAMSGAQMAGFPVAGGPMAHAPMAGFPMAGVPVAGAAASVDAADLVPGPVVSARALLELSEAEFVLAVSRPRPRVVTAGRMVSARLPAPTDRRTELPGGRGAGLGMGDDGRLHMDGGGAGLRRDDGAGLPVGDGAGQRGSYRTDRRAGYRLGYRPGRPGVPS